MILRAIRTQISQAQKQGLKLSFLTSVLVFLSIVLALIISIFSAYQAELKSLTESTLELNKINADRLVATTDSLFVSMKNDLYITGHDLPRYNSEQELQNHLDSLVEKGNTFNSVCLMDKEGSVITSSPLNSMLVGQHLDTDSVKHALSSGQPVVSPPYLSHDNHLIVSISQPVFDDNDELFGLLTGIIYLQEQNILKDMLGKQNSNLNNSYTYVVDRSGSLIYHPDPKRIGEDVSGNAVVKKVMDGASGMSKVINSLGINMLAGYAKSSESGWGIVSQTPLQSIVDISKELIERIIFLSLPFILLLLLLAWWLANKVARPLTELSKFARELSDGEKKHYEFPQIQLWNYEANELNKAIVLAVSVLQERVDYFTYESQTDPLTGLTNRRSMDSYMLVWVEQKVPFSIMILDLDHFKVINDTYGHLMGDEVLKFVAKVMTDVAGKEDICCRFGGEEFVILLPRTDVETAFEIGERIRIRMESSIIPVGKPVTLSAGIASYPESAADTIKLLSCADQALYQAKQGGRNRIVIYE